MLIPFVLAAAVTLPAAPPPSLVLDPVTHAPKLWQGELSAPLQGELSAAVKAWALSKRTELKLAPGSTLRTAESFSTKIGASFHLVQQVNGVDVSGAKVVVTVDRFARVVQVGSSLAAISRTLPAWAIDEREALRRAGLVTPFAITKNGRADGAARKEFFQVRDELHAGWLTWVPSLDQRDNWYVAVDATDGTILWRQNRVHHAALDARAYASSPGGLDAGVGATPTIGVTLTHGDGGSMVLPNDGGYLEGTQVTGYNCCINEGCRTGPDAGMKRVQGSIAFGGFNIPYDSVVCDRQQRASNDPSIHDAGTYEYQPIDPPPAGAPNQAALAWTDEFAEVHSFFHVNGIYDWVRGLSASAAPLFPGHQPALIPFSMRDERRQPAKKPAVWANVVFPNFNEVIQQLFGGQCGANGQPCKINTLMPIGNAAFFPREQFAQLPVAAYQLDVDTLMIFQGPEADFGYDAPVVWHEFGHGVVYSTANLTFDALALDDRSANNETGAMHEGFADYLAAAFGSDPRVGVYVGPRIGMQGMAMGVRTDTYLRTLENDFKCPEVLWGEVHQDAQHLAAAIWQGRKNLFQGSDQGRTYDAVFYATLVSLPPTADFATFVAAHVQHVQTAFGATVTDAGAKLRAIYQARGVIECSKVLDVTAANTPARPMFAVAAASSALAQGTVVPGPFQFKIDVPNGAQSITIAAKPSGGGNPLAQPGTLKMMAKSGQPIRFTKQGNGLTNDADQTMDATTGQSSVNGTLAISVPCGGSVYVALGAAQATTVTELKVTATAATSCPDAGSAGGGSAGGGSAGGGASTLWFHGDLVTDNFVQLAREARPSGQQQVLSFPGNRVNDWAVSPDGQKVLVALDPTVIGRFDLYSANRDGSNLQLLQAAPTGGRIRKLGFSPNGQRIVYEVVDATGQGDLYVLTNGVARLATPPRTVSNPALQIVTTAWNGSGSKLSVIGEFSQDRMNELWVYDAVNDSRVNVSSVAQIGNPLAGLSAGPQGNQAWLANGTLVFKSRYEVDGYRFKLYMSNGTAGSLQLHPVTSAALAQLGAMGVSNDGLSLAYTADGPTPGAYELFVVPASGQSPVRLTSGALDAGYGADFIRPLKFSPDDKSLAFTANYQSGPNVFEPYVAQVSPPGNLRRVHGFATTDAGLFTDQVYWSPDSRSLAVLGELTADTVVELCRIDDVATPGSPLVPVLRPSGGRDVYEAAWTP